MAEWTRAAKSAVLGGDTDEVAYDAVTDSRVRAVLRVLAPGGIPVFEWGRETTPEPDEMIELAERIVASIERTGLA